MHDGSYLCCMMTRQDETVKRFAKPLARAPAISGPVVQRCYRQLKIVLPIWRDEPSSSRSADYGSAFADRHLVVWLGISGPIRVSYEVVKDFQPLMAAMIALAAGTLAYWGAMAKVNLDRAEFDRRRKSEQLGLLLRLRAAVDRVSEEAGAKVKLLTFQPSSDATKISITIIPEQLKIAVPDELTEAWTRLDLFSEVSITQIETLRRLLPMLQNEMEKFAAEKWTVEWVLPRFSIDLPGIPTYRHPVPSDYLVLYSKRCDIIKKNCDLLVKGISSVIENLVK
jgi:hypothetical protein